MLTLLVMLSEFPQKWVKSLGRGLFWMGLLKSDQKFKPLTESSKVSKFAKEEFEAYQKMHHDRWDHIVMVPGIFREFADEINAEISKNVSKNTREIAKKMKNKNMPVEEIIEFTGLTEEEVKAL